MIEDDDIHSDEFYEKRPRLTIIRGLPGSGKSTMARELAQQRNCMMVEPDMFCIKNGNYYYDDDTYANAVDEAGQIVKSFAMFGADIIYADVLPTKEDVRGIINIYERNYWDEFKLTVEVIDLPGGEDHALAYNRHNVRPEDIHRMARDWEPWR